MLVKNGAMLMKLINLPVVATGHWAAPSRKLVGFIIFNSVSLKSPKLLKPMVDKIS